MTENKRFTLHKGLDTLNIMDNTKFNEHIYINKSSKDMELLVGVLNALHEENEDRYNEQQYLQQQIYSRDKTIEALEKENEQLKKELKSFKPIIFESDGKSVTLYEKRGDVE